MIWHFDRKISGKERAKKGINHGEKSPVWVRYSSSVATVSVYYTPRTRGHSISVFGTAPPKPPYLSVPINVVWSWNELPLEETVTAPYHTHSKITASSKRDLWKFNEWDPTAEHFILSRFLPPEKLTKIIIISDYGRARWRMFQKFLSKCPIWWREATRSTGPMSSAVTQTKSPSLISNHD